MLLRFGGDVSALDREQETPLHKATRESRWTAMNLLQRAGADPDAVSCWDEMAGTLAPSYKMNPHQTREDDGGGDDTGPCVACSAKKGRHYYFCGSDLLQDVPDTHVLGPDGLPISES